MKKVCFLVISLFLFSSTVFADNKTLVVTGDGVRFRTGATTSSGIIREFYYGNELTFIEDSNISGNGCNRNWYYASYDGVNGYICSEFAIIRENNNTTPTVNVDEYGDYAEYLRGLGFPESYLPYLIELHNNHPNWQFRVFSSGIDFNWMATMEYDGYAPGWSLIEDTGRYIDGYKSTDYWSYNYLTDTFYHNFSGGGSNWYAPSKSVISYYLDPRNFLNERQIFMFETLSYNSNYHTREGIEAMLQNTFMTGNAGGDKTYVDAFMDAAQTYNISPYVLVSRVIQEVGAWGSTIVSGTVPGYQGYYNFYNINATGAQGQIIANGLSYARSQGWDSPYKAIVGGASFLANGYINAGQDTLYLQKWDLILPQPGRHQYMQNVQAPSTESIKTYNGYNRVGLVNSNFVFSIPVFLNMPDQVTLPSAANPNNYLSSLSVNGSYLFESPTEATSFDIVLDGNVSSIDIGATKINGAARINGTGSVAIPNNNETIKVIVTAGNGDERTYYINITKKIDETVNNALDISEILRLADVQNDGTYIYGYPVGYDVSNIIQAVASQENNATITYLNKNNEVKNNGIIASGDKLQIKTNREEKEYTVILYGDVNGDGKILATDYVVIKNHIMDVKKLTDFEKLCADINHDGKVLATDYVAIKNHIMDIKKIEQ